MSRIQAVFILPFWKTIMSLVRMSRLKFFVNFYWLVMIGFSQSIYAVHSQEINITYFTQEQKPQAALSNLDPIISDKGLQGAKLAIADNNTTGQFTGQSYTLESIIVPVEGNVVSYYQKLEAKQKKLLISNLPLDKFEKIVQIAKKAATLIFDVATTDNKLRRVSCYSNTFYLLPSRAMRADALAQFMLKKRWRKWFLVIGSEPEDQLYGLALKRAAKRFGMKIIAEKRWTHTYDARRTAQRDVPVFTQGVDYDVLVVADEQGLFGEYLQYRTWIPRPIIGTQGLVATSWHRVHEQWGAVQLQNRFKKVADRWMTEQDYAAYLAVRSIGEAATRTKSNTTEKIEQFLLSEQFALQGYKGKPLSFRPWSRQLRQPVLLAAARSMVSVSPQEYFLHPVSELDTLGYDKAEIKCQ